MDTGCDDVLDNYQNRNRGNVGLIRVEKRSGTLLMSESRCYYSSSRRKARWDFRGIDTVSSRPAYVVVNLKPYCFLFHICVSY